MLTLFVVAIGALVLYALACWWRPFGGCRRCRGAGRFASRNGRHWRNCPRCGGTGRRLRLGRRVTNRW